MLQTNSNRTAKEMAMELSLTPTPVYERIKKLEKAGYIKQYVALLNTDLLNKNIIVFMNITIKDHHKEARDEFVKSMEALDEVSEFYHTSGSFDFLAKVRFGNIKSYRDFLVNEVAAIRNINDIDSQIVFGGNKIFNEGGTLRRCLFNWIGQFKFFDFNKFPRQ